MYQMNHSPFSDRCCALHVISSPVFTVQSSRWDEVHHLLIQVCALGFLGAVTNSLGRQSRPPQKLSMPTSTGPLFAKLLCTLNGCRAMISQHKDRAVAMSEICCMPGSAIDY